jgi:hypothetical protein
MNTLVRWLLAHARKSNARHVQGFRCFKVVKSYLKDELFSLNIRSRLSLHALTLCYGNGGIAIANAAGQSVGIVALGSHPESFQFEPNGDLV